MVRTKTAVVCTDVLIDTGPLKSESGQYFFLPPPLPSLPLPPPPVLESLNHPNFFPSSVPPLRLPPDPPPLSDFRKPAISAVVSCPYVTYYVNLFEF